MHLIAKACFYNNNGMRERGIALYQGDNNLPFAIVPVHACIKNQIYDISCYMPVEFGTYENGLEVKDNS